jgi:hypothetical protein
MIACFTALLFALAGSVRAAEMGCEDLARLSLSHTEITAVTPIPKGQFTPPPGAIDSCNPALDCESGPATLYAGMPSFCRVQATLRPTSDSEIMIEIWLSTAGWNGRLQAVGDAANPMTRLEAATLYGSLIVNKNQASFVSRVKWAAYSAAALSSCDAADGVKDGLLSNPLACMKSPRTSEQLYPGYPVGARLDRRLALNQWRR